MSTKITQNKRTKKSNQLTNKQTKKDQSISGNLYVLYVFVLIFVLCSNTGENLIMSHFISYITITRINTLKHFHRRMGWKATGRSGSSVHGGGNWD